MLFIRMLSTCLLLSESDYGEEGRPTAFLLHGVTNLITVVADMKFCLFQEQFDDGNRDIRLDDWQIESQCLT